jgi:hypothetical protein
MHPDGIIASGKLSINPSKELDARERLTLNSQKEITMKNHRTLDLIALALVVAGSLLIPAGLRATGAPDSAQITKLLADTKAVSVQLKTDSGQMDSYTRSKLSWQSYSDKIEIIKGHINNAGQLLAKLKDAESTGSPWQQATIKRIEPLLKEMADNLTATINHLNDNKNKLHFPEFIDYVKANYALATDTEALLRVSVDYGMDKAKFELLSAK